MTIHKKPSSRKKPHPDFVYEIAEHDDNTKYLFGWPGYRTAQNKSGLGYLETQAEWGHMQGVIIHLLITGKFQTRNPFYLLAMTVIGVFCGGLPTIFILYEIAFRENWSILYAPIQGFLIIAINDLLLINVVLSLLNWNSKTITGD